MRITDVMETVGVDFAPRRERWQEGHGLCGVKHPKVPAGITCHRVKGHVGPHSSELYCINAYNMYRWLCGQEPVLRNTILAVRAENGIKVVVVQ